MREAICWMNGELMPAHAAAIPVLDHGLLYGDGVFEGIRFYHGRAFRLAAHLERLALSARAIALVLPLERAALEHAVEQTITAYGYGEGYLRVVVTRGVGPLGLDPSACTTPNLLIIADAISLHDPQRSARGIRVVIAATRRLAADGLDPRVKSLNYLNNVLARIEASHAGADEAILLNREGRVAEGSAENLFIVRNGELATPPVSEGALDGITRRCVIELARSAGIGVHEMPLSPYDLYTADECFLTGTGAELIAVREIDGRPLPMCPGVVFADLLTRFHACVRDETQPTTQMA
ncbi:MAG: branched-chain-amino-acid transaminase [Gammaproteobacteria bacterium]|nr:branched-chain-amino-acid transaminase [Gammaproteobacteria bacterium]MCB1924794.1 branched-chain-amino-acid transaminase [Gammaproteobacteria bacterium]